LFINIAKIKYIEILPLLFPFREGDLGGGSEIKIYNDMGELVKNLSPALSKGEGER